LTTWHCILSAELTKTNSTSDYFFFAHWVITSFGRDIYRHFKIDVEKEKIPY